VSGVQSQCEVCLTNKPGDHAEGSEVQKGGILGPNSSWRIQIWTLFGPGSDGGSALTNGYSLAPLIRGAWISIQTEMPASFMAVGPFVPRVVVSARRACWLFCPEVRGLPAPAEVVPALRA
jgi:hypothetical protein